MRLPTLIAVSLITVGSGLAVTLSLRHQSGRLRQQLAQTRERNATQPAPATSTTPHIAPNRSVSAEIDAARSEIAALEARAERERTATISTDLAPPGLTRLEDLHDVGRQTPGAAVHTLLWAACRGDDTALANTLLLEAEARAKAAAFLADLPDSAREKLPTPESFAALFLSDGLTKVTAVRIGEATAIDPDNATVRLEGIMNRELQLPLRRATTGWQIVVGEKQIDWAITQLRASPAK
ncbi:MAG: hypothetical protein HYV96_16605 [Opitutae bacterium]|nr:hypothetical protein [Opitutae bacterium]